MGIKNFLHIQMFFFTHFWQINNKHVYLTAATSYYWFKTELHNYTYTRTELYVQAIYITISKNFPSPWGSVFF